MTWIRSGYCRRCGECCRGDPFNGEEGPAPVAGYCPLYRQFDDIGHCAGYGRHPYYLNGCNVWPTHPAQIADKPGCSYRFEWVDGD